MARHLAGLSFGGERRFRVNYGLSRPTAATSAFRGKADEIGTITDIGQRMSAVEGRADVVCQGLSGPFIARSGHLRFDVGAEPNAHLTCRTIGTILDQPELSACAIIRMISEKLTDARRESKREARDVRFSSPYVWCVAILVLAMEIPAAQGEVGQTVTPDNSAHFQAVPPELHDVTPEQLNKILETHRTWLDSAGKEGQTADLSESNLARIDLPGTNLSMANLQSADLSEANLSGASLQWASLAGANLLGALLSKANLKRADLVGTNLQGADLRGTKLREADLLNADLQWAVLRDAQLQKSVLRDANFQYADLGGASLWKADLTNADLRDAEVNSADLRVADLTTAQLQGATFIGANLEGAWLRGASLQGADLRSAKLRESRLHGADLRGANLDGAKLEWAILTGANLMGVVGLTQDQLDQACGDDKTQLPDNLFIPLC